MLKVHMSLAVQDVPATSAFYETLFQSPPIKTKDDYVTGTNIVICCWREYCDMPPNVLTIFSRFD